MTRFYHCTLLIKHTRTALHLACSFDLKFGDDTLSFDPGADLLLCTHTNFWDAIVDVRPYLSIWYSRFVEHVAAFSAEGLLRLFVCCTGQCFQAGLPFWADWKRRQDVMHCNVCSTPQRRWIEGKNVGVVILPPFSSDSSPHPDGTIAKLVKATTEGGIATIPSVPEYVSIGLKDIEYSRCTWLSIPVVPYKVSEPVTAPFKQPQAVPENSRRNRFQFLTGALSLLRSAFPCGGNVELNRTIRF